jgi:voltage-gated potassium channel Kch
VLVFVLDTWDEADLTVEATGVESTSCATTISDLRAVGEVVTPTIATTKWEGRY